MKMQLKVKLLAKNKRQATKTVRIIAGEFKGFRLGTPLPEVAHVMGERERGAIFNALFDVSELHVLDCFAGSGALGFEALSRGALTADFVENEARARVIIQENAAKLDVKSRARMFKVPPIRGRCPPTERMDACRNLRYDLIFSDAPYTDPQWELVETLPDLLMDGGRLVISHSKEEPIPDAVVVGLENTYSKIFAGAQIDIYVKM
ncbi:RsmD family RNA methyltransferase [Candidatus Saccharibacteria bacterium]|nr:RsmD family RNA methyltransferase [Candidatus Saccharibacteria bacterium]